MQTGDTAQSAGTWQTHVLLMCFITADLDQRKKHSTPCYLQLFQLCYAHLLCLKITQIKFLFHENIFLSAPLRVSSWKKKNKTSQWSATSTLCTGAERFLLSLLFFRVPTQHSLSVALWQRAQRCAEGSFCHWLGLKPQNIRGRRQTSFSLQAKQRAFSLLQTVKYTQNPFATPQACHWCSVPPLRKFSLLNKADASSNNVGDVPQDGVRQAPFKRAKKKREKKHLWSCEMIKMAGRNYKVILLMYMQGLTVTGLTSIILSSPTSPDQCLSFSSTVLCWE